MFWRGFLEVNREDLGRLFRKSRKTLPEDLGRLLDLGRFFRKTSEDWKNLPEDTEDPAPGKSIKGDEQSQSGFCIRGMQVQR